MAGRHRKIPAWRRLLLRLRRSDRAARTAALRAEVVALRATVHALRAELDAAWEAAAAAAVLARTSQAARWGLQLPLVQAALAPAEVADTAALAAATPMLVGVGLIELDLRPDTAMTEIVLVDTPANVTAPEHAAATAEKPAVATVGAGKRELPESALLDPRTARDAELIDVAEPATAAPADTILPERRTA
jgi:hypothetical protein